MDIYEHRRARLLALIEEQYENSRVRFCDASGVSESRLSQILSAKYRDGHAFTEKTARSLEEAVKLPSMYFDQGAAPAPTTVDMPEGWRRAASVIDDADPSFVQIRKVKLRLSAGIHGFQTEPDSRDGETISLRRTWVERNRFIPERLVAIKVKGESMEPALYEGDIIVIDTTDTKPVDGNVYAVNYEGEAVVKRLTRDAGDWWLTSDNSDRKFHRKICRGNDCIIVGRVVRKESDRI